MICPSCSSDIPGDSRFCSYCGITIPRCLSCGNLHPIQATFCPQCGTPTSGDTEPPTVFSESSQELPNEDEKWLANAPADVVGFLYEPNFPEKRHYLKTGDITIGAGDKNDIVVDKPAVSWNHALIIARDGRLRIQDSASTNGTYVNDVSTDRPRNLRHGDNIRFGNVGFRLWVVPQLRDGANG